MEKEELMKKNFKELNGRQRSELIRKLDIDKDVLEYLKKLLRNLLIKKEGGSKENIMDLMNEGELEGWCWEATESAIVFFNDEDTIERGYLIFGLCKDEDYVSRNIRYVPKVYHHSWICFKFNDIMWVFDPCLQIITQKDIYYHIFEITEIEGIVSAKEVREELIYQIKHKENKKEDSAKKKETWIRGNNDPKTPMYRSGGTGYIASINDNGKINNLIAYYHEIE